MSIATQLSRLTTLRNNIRTKLINLGVISDSSADLEDCYNAINGITAKAAATITPTTTAQSIAAGQYLTGAQTIAGDANLLAQNIKKNVPIFGVTGTATVAEILESQDAHGGRIVSITGDIGQNLIGGITPITNYYIDANGNFVTQSTTESEIYLNIPSTPGHHYTLLCTSGKNNNKRVHEYGTLSVSPTGGTSNQWIRMAALIAQNAYPVGSDISVSWVGSNEAASIAISLASLDTNIVLVDADLESGNVSKLTINGVTRVDLTNDTVSAASMLSGITAHDAAGDAITGTIATKTSSNLTVSGATVTAPAGYYASAASKAVASGSATTPATTITSQPSISVNSSGLITATNSKTQSVTPTVSAGYVSSGTAGTITVSGSNTQQLTTKAATTYTPGTTNQTIASETYLTGAQTILGDENLTSANIVEGASIFGVIGAAQVTDNALLYVEQTLTESQIAQVFENLGLGSAATLGYTTTT